MSKIHEVINGYGVYQYGSLVAVFEDGVDAEDFAEGHENAEVKETSWVEVSDE